MLQIVIPMAGEGSRFSKAGYVTPKPFLPINGEPMIAQVIRNLTPAFSHKFLLICKEEHETAFDLHSTVAALGSPIEIISTPTTTRGASETVLLAEDYIARDQPRMIANSDQLVEFSIDDYLEASQDVDGLIMTLHSADPKWSYAKTDKNGLVLEVREKEVISTEATTGIYNFKVAKSFIDSAKRQISLDQKTMGEFYVAPIYNDLISKGKVVKTYNVEQRGGVFHGLGTPEDYEQYLKKTALQ